MRISRHIAIPLQLWSHCKFWCLTSNSAIKESIHIQTNFASLVKFTSLQGKCMYVHVEVSLYTNIPLHSYLTYSVSQYVHLHTFTHCVSTYTYIHLLTHWVSTYTYIHLLTYWRCHSDSICGFLYQRSANPIFKSLFARNSLATLWAATKISPFLAVMQVRPWLDVDHHWHWLRRPVQIAVWHWSLSHKLLRLCLFVTATVPEGNSGHSLIHSSLIG